MLTAIYFFHQGINLDISFSTGPNPIPIEPHCPQFNDALLIVAYYLYSISQFENNPNVTEIYQCLYSFLFVSNRNPGNLKELLLAIY